MFFEFFYQFKENEEFSFITLKKSSNQIIEERYKKFINSKEEIIELFHIFIIWKRGKKNKILI